MRLINCTTLQLGSFDDPPPYAILSHTWEDGEVTLQDMGDVETASQMTGFAKIAMTCRLALSEGIGFAWIDTCCIDKTNNAELSEAINSMFAWYKGSSKCYVYLSDHISSREASVQDLSVNPETAKPSGAIPKEPLLKDEEISSCRWFTRGWTLQELIAPPHVQFYDRNCTFIGTKANSAHYLSSITKIDENVLSRTKTLRGVLVGHRMAWASTRTTTRIEDMAYCLLGIFDINMPLIYGERNKAFIRLQEEIIRSTSDLTIFSWRSDRKDPRQYRGLLAETVYEFQDCHDLVPGPFAEMKALGEYTISNGALLLHGLLEISREYNYYLLPLGCKQSLQMTTVAICLYQYGPSRFTRALPWDYAPSDIKSSLVDIPSRQYTTLRSYGDLDDVVFKSRDGSIVLIFPDWAMHDIKFSIAEPQLQWNRLNNVLLSTGESQFAGRYYGSFQGFREFWIFCGRDYNIETQEPKLKFYCAIISSTDPKLKNVLAKMRFAQNAVHGDPSIIRQTLESLDYPSSAVLRPVLLPGADVNRCLSVTICGEERESRRDNGLAITSFEIKVTTQEFDDKPKPT